MIKARGTWPKTIKTSVDVVPIFGTRKIVIARTAIPRKPAA
jgi:hypothetical protein